MRCTALILAAACLVVAPAVDAQEPAGDHIETDRDSFTPATTTAGTGRLILESAYSFIDNRGVPETHSYPEFVARYGVADWLELRLGANYEVGGESSSVSGGSGGGVGDIESAEVESEAKISYGIKALVSDQDGWIPRSAAIVQGNTPTSGPETATHVVATYVWGWELAERWNWDSAIRYGDGNDQDDQFNRWAPSTVIKAEVVESWTAHIEYFGIFTDGREEELSEPYLSPGIHYLVTQDLEVGVRIGWGLGADAANFFANVGVGVRF